MIRTLFRLLNPRQPRRPVYTASPTASSRYQNSAPPVQIRDVRVAEVIDETPDAKTIVLEFPSGEPFRYQAGQFLTFLFTINGEEIRRAYSFSSSPHGDAKRASVTVKRIADGVGSNFIHTNVKAGDLLRIIGPSGDFTIPIRPGEKRRLVFVAGGSGITPIRSLTETLLATEPEVEIELIYGNRGETDIIFRKRLDELAAQYPNLKLTHVLQEPPDGWPGPAGMVTGQTVLDLVADRKDKAYYLCGPQAMMDGITPALRAAGVAERNIHIERFVTPHKEERPTAPMAVTFLSSGRTVTQHPGDTILETGLDNAVPLDYSCTMGGCGVCRVKLVSGTVIMDEPNCLTPEERREGYILACCSAATSPVEIEE